MSISITYNGKQTSLNNSQLLEALRELNIKNEQFALAINETFVPKSEYSTITLKHNDALEILTPMQGG